MIRLSFDIKDYTDINTMIKERYGHCKHNDRLLSIPELEALAKKYETDFSIMWVYDFGEERSVPAYFIMDMEDHMYSAYILTET